MKSKTKNKKTRKKAVLIILSVILCLIIIALSVIGIINSKYEYDPIGVSNTLSQGETGVLNINYNGADGMPENEQITYSKLETVTLPTLTKKGYHFAGWRVNWLHVGNEIKLNSKTANARAQFEKDYTAISSPCAVYTNELEYKELSSGKYESINLEATDMFVDGGYKVKVYSKENFEGEEIAVYYSGMFSGFIGSMEIIPVESNATEIKSLTDDVKLSFLEKYAPRIWWDKDEEFFSSTIENADKNMEKALTPYGYAYYIKELDSPEYMNEYLHGDLENSKAYAFAVEKEFKYLDLSYFVFTPYNKAKVVAGIQFGNHIGDWEHLTVRLMKENEGNKTYYRPVLVDYSAHSFRNYVSWDEIETVDETHPVAYTAQGSHGMWKDGGSHVYVDAKIIKLTDECSEGTAWDLWQKDQMETYSYDALSNTGKGIGASKWNSAFDLNYCDENGAITRWGNTGWRPQIQIYPRLQSGPGGPQQKDCITNYYVMNNKNIY